MNSSEQKEEIFTSEDFEEKDTNENENDVAIETTEEKEDSELQNEKIEPIKAFQIFGGKLFDPKQRITKNEDVFDTTTKADAQFESPLQKYKRLKSEIEQFNTELQDINERVSKDSIDPTKGITQSLNNEISSLWSHVEEFKNNPQLGSLFSEANSSNLETVDASYLFKRLQQFQSQSQDSNDNNENNENNENNDGTNQATFTLYSDGSANYHAFRSKEIQDRIANLEKVVGPTQTTNVGDMTRSIEYLNKRLDLLADDRRLDQLARRAQVLREKLQQFQNQALQKIEDQITKTKEEKIDKMFDMMTQWDQAAIQLPTIVTRLRSLKNLHEESADVVTKVQNLDSQHSLIKQTLESNQQILNQVNKSLSENATTMANNVQSIEDRITKLQDAMKKSGI